MSKDREKDSKKPSRKRAPKKKATSRNILAKNDIKTPLQLQKKVDEFFKEHEPEKVKDDDGKYVINRFGNIVTIMNPPTITGLALHLGYSTPDSFKNPEGIFKTNKEFEEIIKRAKAKIGNELNKAGLMNNLNPKLVMMNLACNHGMVEKKEVKLDAKVTTVSEATKGVLEGFDEDEDNDQEEIREEV